MSRYIAYLRVSRERQGRSGLGLEAQRKAVADYIAVHGGGLVCEYVEMESGKRCDRAQLDMALRDCRHTGSTLIIAKLDRLARDTAFLLKIVSEAGEEGVVFCDLPQLPAGPAGKLVLTMFAAVAEYEGGMISQRTKDALAHARARGVKLGNPENLPCSNAETARRAAEAAREKVRAHASRVMPYIEQARKAGASSQQQIARALEARGVKTVRGKTRWSTTQVNRVMAHAQEATPRP